MRALFVAGSIVSLLTLNVPHAVASDALKLMLKDHRWSPEELHVPAGQKLVIEVDNQDPTAEEFDSVELQAEKVIAGGSKGLVRLHALEPGRYHFQGEYHEATAQGVIVAK